MDLKDKIRKALAEADVMGLIKMGAPEDEYNSEADLLMISINHNSSVEFIQQALWNVFYSQFCIYSTITKLDKITREFVEVSIEPQIAKDPDKIIGSIEEYKEAAEKIHQIYKLSPLTVIL